MSIPESQLLTWSNHGATTTAKATHETVRRAIETHQLPVGVRSEVFLQGSYKNSTNIRGDSDVDMVVLLMSSWYSDTSRLSSEEKALYDRDHSTSAYKLHQFKADVLTSLRSRFGPANVVEKDKCLHVKANSSRLAADVVVAIQHKAFMKYRSREDQEYVEGIKFQTASGRRWVINYPKPHYENGVVKNSDLRTNGRFKPTVRILKNLRTHLSNIGSIQHDLAPSYFIECLLYNVPDGIFGSSCQATFNGIVGWFIQQANTGSLSNLTCQNEQQLHLFGTEPEQWSTDSATDFFQNIVYLWQNWG